MQKSTSQGQMKAVAASSAPPPTAVVATSTSAGVFPLPDGKTIEIREVWASNLEEEFVNICEVIEKYPFVAMDTEFPGIVARPVAEYSSSSDMIYETLSCNVNMLKMIQIGLSFCDKDGNWAEGCACWQFNFKFSLADDMFAQDSIELLKHSGIDFEKFDKMGIEINRFAELMMMSGLVLNDEVKWLTFASTYDFGYLVKALTNCNLPTNETDFLDILHIYFPCIYDVKYMMENIDGLYGGLEKLANILQLERVGPMHQAGSDCLLTAQTYFALVKRFWNGVCDESRFKGELYGLGSNHTRQRAKQYIIQAASQQTTVVNGQSLVGSSNYNSNGGGSGSSSSSSSSIGSTSTSGSNPYFARTNSGGQLGGQHYNSTSHHQNSSSSGGNNYSSNLYGNSYDDNYTGPDGY